MSCAAAVGEGSGVVEGGGILLEGCEVLRRGWEVCRVAATGQGSKQVRT
jgi:hypothetical protein